MQQPQLHLLYEDNFMISQNCFVMQLHETLKQHFSIIYTSRQQLINADYMPPSSKSLVLCLLKQRTWRRCIPFLRRYAENSSIIMYDQDPWEAYHDNASSPGIYKDVYNTLPIKRFLVTSGWWANYIKETDDLPVQFVRMGILPRLCTLGQEYSKREHDIGFQGSLHSHRKAFVDNMQALGLDISCFPSVGYMSFLQRLENIKTVIHSEISDVKIDGILSYNGIWIKDIEHAARGCFSIRNFDLDKVNYDIDDLPTIFSFTKEEEAPNIIDNIRAMPEKERNERQAESVSKIIERNDWLTVVDAIKDTN